MRSVKTLLLAVLALSCTAVAAADFNVWGDLGFTKSYGKKFSWGMEGGWRARNGVGRVTRLDFSVSAAYKPVKYVKIGAGYAFIADWHPTEIKEHFNSKGKLNGYNIDNGIWRPKNRLFADVTGKLPLGRLTLSLRERYQYTRYPSVHYERDKYRGKVPVGYEGEQYGGYAWEETTEEMKRFKTKHYLRSRIGAEYNIRHCPVTPYASFVISNSLTNGFSLDKRRYIVGAEWKICKQHTLSLSYIYTNGQDDEEDGNIHAVGIGYNYKF